MALSTVLEKLTSELTAHRPELVAALQPGIDDDDLAKLSKALQRAVPDDLAALLRWHDGSARDGGNLIWNYRLLGAEEIGEIVTMFRGHLAAGEFADKIDWWVNGWLPILDNGGGDYICIDTAGSFGGAAGQLLEFQHDDDPRDVIAPSLEKWLAAIAAALESKMFDGSRPRDEAAFKSHLAGALPGYPKQAAARKNDAKAKARVSVRDAIKNAIHPLDGPVADLTVPIDADKVLKAAKLEVASACKSLAARRATATVHVFEILPAPKAKKVAYAVWSTSTVGDNWKDGYVVGVDLKGNAVLKEKKVQG